MATILKLNPSYDAEFSVTCNTLQGGHVGEPHSGGPLWGFFTFPTLAPNPEVVPEVFVKILDARKVNGKFWFFWNGLTDQAYDVEFVGPDDVAHYYKVEFPDVGGAQVEVEIPPHPPSSDRYTLLPIPVQFDDWKFPYTQDTMNKYGTYAVETWKRIYTNGDKPELGKLFSLDLIWPPVARPGKTPSCDMSFQSEIVKAVRTAGHKGQDFMFGPPAPTCGGRSNATYIKVPSEGIPVTLAHEMGHRLGLAHTSKLPIPSLPADMEAAYAQPWLEQYEYSATDLMGEGNTPGYPQYDKLSGYNMVQLGLKVDQRLSWQRGRWTYLAYWWGTEYELSVLGPYKGHWGSGPRNYAIGTFNPGGSWVDKTGYGLATATIRFGLNGLVTIE